MTLGGSAKTGVGTEGLPGLAVVRDLLDRLHEERVVYCHWKSNQHVRAGLLGDTDLDVLLDRAASESFDRLASESGFKRFTAVPLKAYPGIDDYFGADPETGRLAHIHLHHQLALGEQHLKGYRAPWESLVLSTRRYDSEEGIYVADPDVEMVLLLVRAALKLRARERWLGRLEARRERGWLLREYRYLREQCEPARISTLARSLLGARVSAAMSDLLAKEPTVRRLAAFAAVLKPEMAAYRSYGSLRSRWRAVLRELFWIFGVVLRSVSGAVRTTRRTNPRGGIVVAVLGCDGSGKSTVSREVARWLSRKVDVASIYLGSGEGPASFVRWPLKAARDLVVALRRPKAAARDATNEAAVTAPGRLENAFRAVGALALAHEKRRKLARVNAARNLGMIVVCDRYPQNQVMGSNDGPLLSHWLGHRSVLLSALARWEAVPYRRAELCPPDLVFRLGVTPEAATGRKPEMSLEYARARAETVRSLHFAPPTKTIEIDSNADLDSVLLEVKQRLWQEL